MEHDYATVGNGIGKTTTLGGMDVSGLGAGPQSPALNLTEAAAQVGGLSQTAFQVCDSQAGWRVANGQKVWMITWGNGRQ